MSFSWSPLSTHTLRWLPSGSNNTGEEKPRVKTEVVSSVGFFSVGVTLSPSTSSLLRVPSSEGPSGLSHFLPTGHRILGQGRTWVFNFGGANWDSEGQWHIQVLIPAVDNGAQTRSRQPVPSAALLQIPCSFPSEREQSCTTWFLEGLCYTLWLTNLSSASTRLLTPLLEGGVEGTLPRKAVYFSVLKWSPCK